MIRSKNWSRSLLLLGSVLVGLPVLSSTAQDVSPDAVFLHGNVLTGAHLRSADKDPLPARVQALAVRDGRIIAAGTDETVAALKGEHTRVVDLHGAFVMPGFNDAHTHMAQAGQQRLSVDLVGSKSLGEMQERIRAYTARAKPGEWVLGGGWDHTLWPGKALPTRSDLDAVTAGHPALLLRVDGHIAVANTAALYAVKITGDTPDPEGGQIDHGADGQPTGVIREAPALALVQSHIPKTDPETRKRALKLSIDDALAHGVTSVQDFSDWEDWLVLESLERKNELPLRFAEWIAFDTPLPILETRRASHASDDVLLHLTQLKAFMDGSLGSRTATLDAPYSDDEAVEGLPRYEQDRLNDMASQRVQAGFQLGFHAIGDHANEMALNAFEESEQAFDAENATSSKGQKTGDFRFRIEHAQVVSAGDFERFRRLGVIASMQPSHLLTDMAWAGQRLGPDRSKRAYAWKSFLDHSVTLAFGTDYPVESISPFRGLYAAITRQNEAGSQTFEPQERISLNEAIYAYTQGAAFAEFRERQKGRLEPGFCADFVVLDRDITRVPAHDLLQTQVLRTVVGGVTRFQASAAGADKSSPSGALP